jgi:hypothetical protein
MSWEKYQKIVRVLPSDYSLYGGRVDRWSDVNTSYSDCSSGCRWFAKTRDGWGVCTNPAAPRAGLLTWEHQAGFGCFEPNFQQLIDYLKGDQLVVINTCYGGFGLSDRGLQMYAELSGQSAENIFNYEIPRDCPHLVKTVQMLGRQANDKYSDLKIVSIPAGVEWTITEYDGKETVSEQHKTWG